MTIDIASLDRSLKLQESLPVTGGHGAASSAPVATLQAAPPQVSEGDVTAAVQQLQTAINKSPNPDFKLDYLSGLSVVTVRSNLTGEIVFQLPDTRAVELARLIKNGASVGSIGLLNTTA